MTITITAGDCREVMRQMAPNRIGAIVTDPPYGLEFCGAGWDHEVPGVDFWREGLRVAKPGCHLAAFGGTRKWHRLACAIEDAGWEIRDSLIWLYGSGMPHGVDVSKELDRRRDRSERSAILEFCRRVRAARDHAGKTPRSGRAGAAASPRTTSPAGPRGSARSRPAASASAWSTRPASTRSAATTSPPRPTAGSATWARSRTPTRR